MKKLVIKEINNYDYALTDDNGLTYRLNIEFYSTYKPQINDILYIDDSVLKEINLFAYDEIYDAINCDIKDIIKIVSNENNYYFQRRYG